MRVDTINRTVGTGDVTTYTIEPADASPHGRIVAKQEGLVAGLAVAEHVMLLNERMTFVANVVRTAHSNASSSDRLIQLVTVL